VREGLVAASTAIGLEVMGELMEAEVCEIAGPKGRHDRDERRAYRHGTEQGSVALGGRRVAVRRPERSTDAEQDEIELGSYRPVADSDLVAEHKVASMLAGLSARTYWAALDPVGEPAEQQAASTSKSAVSRQFVTAPSERLAELHQRRLNGQRWPVVFVDGFTFGKHQLVGALRVTAEGGKLPLGVGEGATENAAVATRLLADLVDRGLDTSLGVLLVVDGSKALDTAICSVFGDTAGIQRCRRHKQRNVLDHLPEGEHAWVRRKLRAAWMRESAEQAEAELEEIARSLQRKRPGAAASLRLGLAGTVTVNRLGVGGKLLQTVESTNPVETMIEIVAWHASPWQRAPRPIRLATARPRRAPPAPPCGTHRRRQPLAPGGPASGATTGPLRQHATFHPRRGPPLRHPASARLGLVIVASSSSACRIELVSAAVASSTSRLRCQNSVETDRSGARVNCCSTSTSSRSS
jgi:hypothetical protein